MTKIVVRGGRRLGGRVAVGGSKNAGLPLLFAALLTPERCTIRGLPRVADILTTLHLLQKIGCLVGDDAFEAIMVEARDLTSAEAPYELVKTMRASFLTLGPLVARTGYGRVATPGGCAIGSRPVDIHLAGLERLGATIRQAHGYVEAEAPRLRGARITLDFPSVGATENLMMAATLADGVTEIENAACEPEIEDLAAALVKMGARVAGAGSTLVTVEGVRELGAFDHTVIPDRIEAGTLLIAGAITGGDVTVDGARAEHLDALLAKLEEAGVGVERGVGAVGVRAGACRRATDVRTAPHPGFPTDLQAQFMALMTTAEGRSMITETIFENRFMHVQELVRMGADIRVDGKTALVRGVPRLSGAPVMATDLRASVCLVLAALAAQNTSEIARVYHLDRGYERLEAKLSSLGADVERVRG
ncbi:MAG: UDP-N-acetylglucosamine 1-carboxyvinyltransferase [Polyangiaceae bacterium UTPRO1]|jgi:UDP-N-acetylglucosamine 1-carboxyvinyltransferase|nr:UDP-N-acetylglucosamine 1-carboxyvinyltransferase [Myxococcales bacterium]OQY67897.1 MAG: UDP-N-acetylglucosamine 1-carboxyvinyltransferase [Polyangiaceae bacterium UTPRO1]